MKWSEFKAHVDSWLERYGQSDATIWNIDVNETMDGLAGADLRVFLTEKGDLSVLLYDPDEVEEMEGDDA